ncbi:uncharacterized protein LOC136033130 [Artemia franciscana]|uniref:BTB domain-containing protein n=1 Tax=Artemia franciscana TaxID=6661 RepID=A0AA88I9Z9_ARTSF|nr:hypothetical protein QYM36_001706 [Artemia franciscana]
MAFAVHWEEHFEVIKGQLAEIVNDAQFANIRIICDDGAVAINSFVLRVLGSFKTDQAFNSQTSITLKGSKLENVYNILRVACTGEVLVAKEHVPNLITAASFLDAKVIVDALKNFKPGHALRFQWKNHYVDMKNYLDKSMTDENQCDVTFRTRNGVIHSHKAVLSACSGYLHSLFLELPQKSPVHLEIVDTDLESLTKVLDFCHNGEVKVITPCADIRDIAKALDVSELHVALNSIDQEAEIIEKPIVHVISEVANQEKTFGSFVGSGFFSDIIISAGGKYVKAHRVILSSFSPKFGEIFKKISAREAVLFFTKNTHSEILGVIDYIYKGRAAIEGTETQVRALLSEWIALDLLPVSQLIQDENVSGLPLIGGEAR